MPRENLDVILSDLLTEPEARNVVCIVTTQDGETGLHMKATVENMLYAIHLLRNQIKNIEASGATRANS